MDWISIKPELYAGIAAALEALKRGLRWAAGNDFGPFDRLFEAAADFVDSYTAALLILFAFAGYGLSGFSLSPEALSIYDALKDLVGLLLSIFGSIVAYKAGAGAKDALLGMLADTEE